MIPVSLVLFMLQIRVVIPRPSIKLKTVPAIQPVKAISPKPLLAIDTSAITSPREFPHESTVIPSRAGGSAVMIPKS